VVEAYLGEDKSGFPFKYGQNNGNKNNGKG
jgi:hypothetical protein